MILVLCQDSFWRNQLEQNVSLTAVLVFLKMSRAEYFDFEARMIHAIEVQRYRFFCKVITEIALDPSVCEAEHLSSVSGLTAVTSG